MRNGYVLRFTHHDHQLLTGGIPMLRFLLAVGLGAALVYFLDPERGEERRKKAMEQFSDMTHHGADKLDEAAKYTTSKADELADRTANLNINGTTPDLTNAQSFDSSTPSYT